VTPIDFVRYREFAFAYSAICQFVPRPNFVLDISSPKLLPLTIGYALSRSKVVATDILLKEVSYVEHRKKSIGANNLGTSVIDVRFLPFENCIFDLVTSISVFEHIAPEKGGDLPAIREVTRVLRPGGVLILTVPFSREYFAEYVTRSVYERQQSNEEESIFFQRFYDFKLLQSVFLRESGLKLEYLGFIYERFFSSDPRTRLAHYISASRRQRTLFGPLYPLLSRVFLSPPKPLSEEGKPYIACLILRKGERP
jgi:SAM-dependent methyltransferase